MKQSELVFVSFFLLAALACESPMPEKETERPKAMVEHLKEHPVATTKTDFGVPHQTKTFDAGFSKTTPPVSKPSIKKTLSVKKPSVYDIPKERPSQDKSCKEKAAFGEQVYQKALSVAQKKSCQQNSDCMLVRNTTDCVMKSSCKLESYEGVYKTHAKRLIDLRARLYKEVCPGCKRWAEKCRKPPMTARCFQRSCEAVLARSPLGLKVKIGKVQPNNTDMQKAFSRRAKRFERCAKRYAAPDGFREGRFQYVFSLNDEGMVSTFKTLEGQNYKKLNACLVQIIKPYRYPPPPKDQRQFKQTLQFKQETQLKRTR